MLCATALSSTTSPDLLCILFFKVLEGSLRTLSILFEVEPAQHIGDSIQCRPSNSLYNMQSPLINKAKILFTYKTLRLCWKKKNGTLSILLPTTCRDASIHMILGIEIIFLQHCIKPTDTFLDILCVRVSIINTICPKCTQLSLWKLLLYPRKAHHKINCNRNIYGHEDISFYRRWSSAVFFHKLKIIEEENPIYT